MKKAEFFRRHKTAVILVTVLVLTAGIGCGIWYFLGHNSKDPVYVYPFHYIGMTEYWGDSQESYGPVTTDKLQTVYLSDTQTVVEIAVAPGDAVKKGDLLMIFDTTLSDLQLERKRLEVEQEKLQLEDAREELNRIRNMKPMVIYESVGGSETESDEGRLINGNYEIHSGLNNDGSSTSRPLVLWLSSSEAFGPSIMDALKEKAVYYQTENLKNSLTPPAEGEETGEDIPPVVENVEVSNYYVIIRVTEGNRQFGAKNTWTGLRVYLSDHSIRFFTPQTGDPFMESAEVSEDLGPQFELNSGYTAAQIAQMRRDQEKKIKDLEFSVKMLEADYKIMQLEMMDGNVYAEIDGEVVSVLAEDEAKATQQPVVKVSGGGGFYVEGFVSELEKEKMAIGQEVTVNDWNTGATYTAKISSMGDFPTQEGYFSGMGNPNASYYPFKVFVEEDADLEAGRYVSVMFSAAQGEHGVYLENPFLRTENGRTYVLVLGEDGTLEQRFVTIGKSLWGSYTEILTGVDPEDLIAFPYGKNVKPGAKAVEGDLSNLYG